MPKFHIINGGPKPETAADKIRSANKKSRPPEMMSCPRCGGIEVIETKTGMLTKQGKPYGGTKQWLCTICLLKGERVVVR